MLTKIKLARSLIKTSTFVWLRSGFCHVLLLFYFANGVIAQEAGDILHFQSGETLKRTCWSFYESTWHLPDNDVYRKENDKDPLTEGRLLINESRTTTGWFKVKLTVTNLRYTDTGFYTCKSKTSIFDDISNYSGNEPAFTRVYVIVSSRLQENIFLHRNDDNRNSYGRLVPVWSNRDSYVPCLVTRLDADLTLRIDGAIDKDYHYDPRFGFLIPANSLNFEEARSGRCIGQINESKSAEVTRKRIDRVQILLIPIEHSDLLKPVILLGSDLYPYKHGQLKLYCVYPSDSSKPETAFINCNWFSMPDRTGVQLIGTTASNKTLWIPKLELTHSGNYTCTCRHVLGHDEETSQTYYVDVSPTKGRIFYTSPANLSILERSVGESVQYSVRYMAWPPDDIQVEWFHSYKNAFNRTEIIELVAHQGSNMLQLQDLKLNQSGDYIFRITAGGDLKRELKLFSLIVYGQSHSAQIFVTLSDSGTKVDSRFLEFGASYDFYCISEGNPLPELKMFWNPCVKPTYTKTEACSWSQILRDNGERNIISYGDFQKSIRMLTKAQKSGRYACQVTDPINESDHSYHTQNYIVSDIKDAQQNKALQFTLITADPAAGEIYETDSIAATCRYQGLVYKRIRWTILSNDSLWTTLKTDTTDKALLSGNSTLISDLKFDNIRKKNAGIYACIADYALDTGTGYEMRQFEIFINETVPLYFGNRSSSKKKNVTFGYPPVEIYCDAQGAPKPRISWLKDGIPLPISSNNATNDRNIDLNDGNRSLIIQRPSATDEGVYTCILSNRLASIKTDFVLQVTGAVQVSSIFSYWIIGLFAAALTLLVIVIIFLLVCLILSRRRKKSAIAVQMNYLRQLYADLMSSVDDQLQLDPDQPVNEQTENLPYDQQYEMSMNQLTLGRLLGEGQFGRVYESVLVNSEHQFPTTVAVKTPKVGTNLDQQKALLSEFKIMIYIENHINVLRLLGAITKYIVDGHLYVIVEYCRLGSLADYLKRNRDRFVDEILKMSEPEDAYETSVDVDGYLVPNCQVNSGHEKGAAETSFGAGRRRYRSELDPTWSKKVFNNRSNENYVSTSDLMSYSYQVANGMEYLASKNIIHRDLAVRNVLLNENKIVKICDFGLARQDYAYHATKAGVPLPVKWMAIESILFQEYTVKSDIWSFGVVIWEIFSLAQTPYPGQAVDRNFIRWLKCEENRLPSPDYAPEKIYAIMRQCWLSIPDDRPTFADCRRKIGKEMMRCSVDYYKDLISALSVNEDAKSDSVPPPSAGACQRFNYRFRSSSDGEDRQRFSNSSSDFNAAANSAYFDCRNEIEMQPMASTSNEYRDLNQKPVDFDEDDSDSNSV